MDYNIIQMNENTWRIEDGGVRFFLLTGTEKALLIDSGMMIQNAKEIAESLTDLPISLLNTHADRDHIGSNEEFASFCILQRSRFTAGPESPGPSFRCRRATRLTLVSGSWKSSISPDIRPAVSVFWMWPPEC